MVRCEDVMQHSHVLNDSMATFLTVDQRELDHIFIVDEEGAPLGRIHAVDLLKMIARKPSIETLHGCTPFLLNKS